jgi:hypothetical protein
VNGTRIAEHLAALRESGALLRRRPVEATLDALADVLDGWRHPESSWRRALESELPEATGFSPEVVREGLRLGLEPLRGAKLRELVARELGGPNDPVRDDEFVSGFDTTAVMLAGSIPMPTLIALIAPLALHSPVLAKTASHDPVTAHHVARSLAEADPLLGRCIACVEFPSHASDCVDALLAADCVVAFGSDETIAEIRSRIPPSRRLVEYGHRLSVAVVDPTQLSDAELGDAAARLALDTVLWDQLGCLSPIAAYVIDPGGDAATRFAERIADSLADLEVRLPRGRIDPAASAFASHERAEAEMRAAAGAPVVVHTGQAGGWSVIAEPDATARPAPLHRFIRIHPVSNRDALPAALLPLSRHLAAVGLAGFGSATRDTARRLAQLGASRICALGSMQSPPLAWRHDNRGVFPPLARLANLETPP